MSSTSPKERSASNSLRLRSLHFIDYAIFAPIPMIVSSYPEALEYLYANLPMFQRVGASAYKEDLTNIIDLCEILGNPQHSFKSVHVAGTNGKGSTSHML